MSRLGNFVEAVIDSAIWGESDLVLVDVGASGGIDRRWAAFGERLAAVGFEPLIYETERLNAVETRPKVRYEAALVGCREYDELFPRALRTDEVRSRTNQPFGRSSAVAALRIQQKDYVREQFNAGGEVLYSDRFVTLDEYFAESSLRPDFLKIDTDGQDLQVLLGAANLVSSPDLLGIQVEAQFHGAVHDYANTFANIDRFLRQRGFSLFDLEPYRYSRAALPAPFAIGVPAQTVSGQVLWGEALYFRDLTHPLYKAMFEVERTRDRVLKLCALFSLYGLDDCAAELLLAADAQLRPGERDALLDALTPRLFGDRTYRDYIARFTENPAAWLPQHLDAMAGPAAAPQPHSDEEPTTEESTRSSVVTEVGTHADVRLSGNVLIARNLRLHSLVQEQRERIAAMKKLLRKQRRRMAELDDKVKRLRSERSHDKAQRREAQS